MKFLHNFSEVEAVDRHPNGLGKRRRTSADNVNDETPEVYPTRADDTDPPNCLEQHPHIPSVTIFGSDLRYFVLRQKCSNPAEVLFR